jgi:hypothetical protein
VTNDSFYDNSENINDIKNNIISFNELINLFFQDDFIRELFFLLNSKLEDNKFKYNFSFNFIFDTVKIFKNNNELKNFFQGLNIDLNILDNISDEFNGKLYENFNNFLHNI